MPILIFKRKMPKKFSSNNEELMWIIENSTLDGKKIDRSLICKILGVKPVTLESWLCVARDAKKRDRFHNHITGPRVSGRNMRDASMHLLRLELGLAEPFIKRKAA